MRYAPEPRHRHGTAPATAVLLCNLGTPDAPTPAALRRYLGEFLTDPRVVEIPGAIWWPVLHGVVLRVRPARSARKYASVWTTEGSPLRVWTDKQARRLQGSLGERGHRVLVRWAMRYGTPSIASVLDDLKAQGTTRLLVLPLYPQYSGATTASVTDVVAAWLRRTRQQPELRVVARYGDDPGYIAALARSVGDHWMAHGRGDRLLLSFHGMPRRTLLLGDPYHCECRHTARLLAERLGLASDAVTVTFQSRFGRAEWLQPYTRPTLVALARQGVGRVDVLCPGFAADCLETLEEIAIEGKAAFLGAGGKDFHYIPCLNLRDDWIAALADLTLRHLQGWDTRTPPDPAALERQKARAQQLGAAE
jgi:ferrochelatase